MVGMVENWLEDNATDAQIIAYLESFCKYVPGYEAICDQIAVYGVDWFVNFIRTHDPDTVCKQLGLCPKNSRSAIFATAPEDMCAECEILVQMIENWLEENTTVEEIEARLEAFCKYVPGYEQICDQLVVYGVEWFINFIDNNENPDQVCKQLKLCTQVALPEDKCSECELLVSMVEKWLEENSTEAQIIAYLESLCKHVPGYEQICDQIMVYGVDWFVNYIMNNENPDAVCKQLHMCVSEMKMSDTETCAACKVLVGTAVCRGVGLCTADSSGDVDPECAACKTLAGSLICGELSVCAIEEPLGWVHTLLN